MSVRRSAIVVVSFLLLVAGLPSLGLAQDAGDRTGPGERPVRTLVPIPTPLEPGLPTVPRAPAELAAEWLSSSSDEARRDLLLEVMSGIGLGVYSAAGAPILFGAERSPDDPWLYDFEVALLAADPTTVSPVTVADIAASLALVLTDGAGAPLEPAAWAELIRAAVAETAATDPAGFPLRLARSVELAATGLDLAVAVPLDQPLTPLAATLIEMDILMPLAVLDDQGVADYRAVSASLPASPMRKARASSEATRVAGSTAGAACGRIGSWAYKKGWDAGKLGAMVIRGGAVLTAATPPAQLLHQLFLRRAISVRGGVDNQELHYLHRATADSALFEVQVSVDVELSPDAIRCGALAGLKLPKAGPLPGIAVDWSLGSLKAHVRSLCYPAGCRTGADGSAQMTISPNVERQPEGLGPIEYDRGLVVAHANYLLDLGNAGGRIPLAGAWKFHDIKVSWHRPYRLELHIDSEIETGGLVRSMATAKGRIALSTAEGGSTPRGSGTLRVKTKPRQANGCKGESFAQGSGTVDWQITSAWVDPQTKSASLVIDNGPAVEHPDKLTRPPCKPLPGATSRFSTWEHYFMQSHLRDKVSGVGIPLEGWQWQANEKDFASGGLLASLDYRERCPNKLAGCKGVTHFELHAYPVEE